MNFLRVLVFFLLSGITGCDDGKTIVVYADPILETYARKAIAEFSSGKEIRVEWKIVSTEIIGRHLRYGQPVDLVFAADREIAAAQYPGLDTNECLTIGSDRLVIVECIKNDFAVKIRTSDCLLLAASDTPLRKASEGWLASSGGDSSCRMYADFFGLSREYISRGWTGRAITLERLARQIGNAKVIREGPVIENWHFVFVPATARNPALGKKFCEFMVGFSKGNSVGDIGIID